MFGVLLAVAVFTFFFACHIAFSHLFDVKMKEGALLGFMAAAAVMHVLAFLAAPAPAFVALRVVPWSVDCVSGLAALGFLILGYVEFWSLVERSFSLRILIDTAASESGLTRDQIAKQYSAGLGLDWMIEKRIEDLVGSRMVVPTGSGHRLSQRGRLIACAFRVLQRAFAIA